MTDKSNWTKVKKLLITDKAPDANKVEIENKWRSLTKKTKHRIADFFGVSDQDVDKAQLQDKWKQRLKQLYGDAGLKDDGLDGGIEKGAMLMNRRSYERSAYKPIRPPHGHIKYQTKKDDVLTMLTKYAKEQKIKAIVKNRSFAPTDLKKAIESRTVNWSSDDIENDFFDKPISTGHHQPVQRQYKPKIDTDGFDIRALMQKQESEDESVDGMQNIASISGNASKGIGIGYYGEYIVDTEEDRPGMDKAARHKPEDFEDPMHRLDNGYVIRKPGNEDEIDGRIQNNIIAGLTDNTSRVVGVGFLGKYFLNTEQDRSGLDKEAIDKLNQLEDTLHRPFFTFWVTFVQIVCYIVALCVYGIAPLGFQETVIEAEVLSTGLFIESVSYHEKDNFWIGPRQADLIHLGAKYSPCMRLDSNVEKAIKYDQMLENQTACCIRNDGSGCVQTPRKTCTSILSTWQKWNGPKRYSGSVCGQDPHFCKAPASVEPYEWPDSIINWPICTETAEVVFGGPPHMTCNIAGRPCCHGIQGECTITTREHCQFLRGYFHEEATLCSQISCMEETCGMLPFWKVNRPDQIYRLWISLFIHAGLLQLLISILFQFFIMRDVEKYIGWLRISVIYILSGVAGSLASAIFTPYNVEAGPSGSQFGIISCLFVELIHSWRIIRSPCINLLKLSLLLITLFLIGLLPMVDNYAHFFGFIFGFLLSFALMPHVTFNIEARRRKIIAICLCLFGSLGVFALLIVLFYVIPVYECKFCQYFSCIPFTPTFCRTMEVSIRREGEL